MSDAKALYQALVVDHGNHPRHSGPLEGATHEARCSNPLCGDRVTLRLRVEGGVIRAVAFEARGCLLATASASLLGDLVDGQSPSDALARARVLRALASDPQPPADAGPLEVLRPVRDFPARVGCIALAWQCLEQALA